MKIYLCARYSRRDELRAVAAEAEQLGHTITSRWLNTKWEHKDDQGSSAAPPEYRERHAVEDLEDVLACDLLIAFTESPRSGGRGGRHVEFGAALAAGKRLLVIGPYENLFHHHPRVRRVATLGDLELLLGRDGGLRSTKPQPRRPGRGRPEAGAAASGGQPGPASGARPAR